MTEPEDKKNEHPPEMPHAEFDRAVALGRDASGGKAPRIMAKGEGEAAKELVRLALKHNIPIKYDPDLVQVLSKLDLDQEISEDVYLVVAELLAFIYLVNQEFGQGGPS
jgi:flagellar biosynthesis protein